MVQVSPQLVGFVQFAVGLVSLLYLRPVLSNWETAGSRGFGLFVVAAALWAVVAGADSFVGSYVLSVRLYNLLLLAAQVAALGWLLLALEIADHLRITRRVLAGGLVYVAAGQLLVWTNPFHGLVLDAGTRLNGLVLVPEYGIGFWLLAGVAYALVGVGVVRLATEAVRTAGIRRRQTALLVLAPIPAIAGSVASIVDVASIPYDLTPFGYLLTMAVFAVARFRNRFLDLSSVARYRIVSEMSDGVVTLDDQNRVVDCNAAARRLFDVGGSHVGTPAREFFAAAGSEFYETLRRIDADTTGRELTARVAGGRRQFSVSVTVLDERAVPGRVVVLRDITRLKRRERQLRRQNERLDQFAGIISHDIRNPLHVLKGNLSLIEETGDLERLEPAEQAVERIERITEELLEVARTGVLVEETESVSLAETARDAWATTRVENATLDCRLADDVEIAADRGRLLQVFENLFRNAIEHNEADELTVRVGLLPESGGSERSDGFYVADDGAGIPPDERERVFEHGYTTSDDGTGLGLFIVESVVSAHSWEVEATESWAGGAQFDVRLVQFDDPDAGV